MKIQLPIDAAAPTVIDVMARSRCSTARPSSRRLEGKGGGIEIGSGAARREEPG
ncbi:MAG: hypothetical protein JWN52_4301 [Actinomycetia bacterium]|nr:hypothetical protein [Actinomycetes bacterium]